MTAVSTAEPTVDRWVVTRVALRAAQTDDWWVGLTAHQMAEPKAGPWVGCSDLQWAERWDESQVDSSAALSDSQWVVCWAKHWAGPWALQTAEWSAVPWDEMPAAQKAASRGAHWAVQRDG